MIIVLGCSLSPQELSLLYETWTDYPHLQTEVLQNPEADATIAVHAYTRKLSCCLLPQFEVCRFQFDKTSITLRLFPLKPSSFRHHEMQGIAAKVKQIVRTAKRFGGFVALFIHMGKFPHQNRRFPLGD